jgi:membrane-bound lytic murein transglycosylase F
MRAEGTLARLTDRYFGHVERLNPADVIRFVERSRSVLPQYRQHFHAAQASTGIDWRLLAALAYQESHWDPLATSPTGVRGMMMLTEDTADHLRVSNRLDAKQSIRAGSQYFSDLRDSLPESVPEPDRTWMAIAAYNLGMGHFNGARHIAQSLKKDPESWYEMKMVLPLLARPEYYERLKSGRARGGEAVITAENVRMYYDILSRYEAPYRPFSESSMGNGGGTASPTQSGPGVKR